MPSGGRLTIETANAAIGEADMPHQVVSEPGRYVMLAVSDTGVGMDAETKLRVFEPFFTTKEQGRGTGLGLATVYGIVKQSGGFIDVHSEPHQGATFRVYLPAVPGARATAIRRETERSAKPGNETILVVEDERAVRTMTRLILERAGYHVVEAAAPGEAREIVRSRASEIDLMISDVVMPGAHGPALFKQLSAGQPSLRCSTCPATPTMRSSVPDGSRAGRTSWRSHLPRNGCSKKSGRFSIAEVRRPYVLFTTRTLTAVALTRIIRCGPEASVETTFSIFAVDRG